MAFKKTYYYTRLNDFGEAAGADVGIHDPETGESLQARLKGNHTQASDTELIQAVLDDFYKRHYVDKAMAEAVQTVDELQRQSKAFAVWQKTTEERMAVAEEDRKIRFDEAMSAISQTEGALIEFMTNIAPHLMALLPEEVLEKLEAGNEPTAIDEAQAESN